MTQTNADLVQVRYQKMKNINFCTTRITHSSFHAHSCLEIGVVLSGCVQVDCNDRTYEARTGSLLLFNAYEVHCMTPQPEAVVLLLQLAPSFGREYFARVASVEFECPLVTVSAETKQQILDTILAAAKVFYSEPEVFGMECAGLVAQVVTAVLRNVPYKVSTDSEYMSKKKRIGRKQRLASFVEQHYREKLTLTHLAQSEGITTAYMSRIFGELFRTSFQEYLSTLRLQKALPMLKKPSIYLVDICMECGFSDTRYLNAICQKVYGCSATELREQMQDPNWQDPNEPPQEKDEQFDDATSLQLLQAFANG